MADIFISYKRSQRKRIEQIAEKLQRLGMSVWFDASLEAGSTFHTEINREVRAAKAVIVCWTNDALDSPWVLSEAQIGLDAQALVPVMLERCALPPPFNGVHAYDLSKWRGKDDDPAWLAMIDRIGQKIGRPGLKHLAHALASGEMVVVPGVNEANSAEANKAFSSRLRSRRVRQHNHDTELELSEKLGGIMRNTISAFGKAILIVPFGALALAALQRWLLASLCLSGFIGSAIWITLESTNSIYNIQLLDSSINTGSAFGYVDEYNFGGDEYTTLSHLWFWSSIFANMPAAALFLIIATIPKSVRSAIVHGFKRQSASSVPDYRQMEPKPASQPPRGEGAQPADSAGSADKSEQSIVR